MAIVTRFNSQRHVLQIIPDSDTKAIIEVELSQAGLENLGESSGGVQKTGITNTSRTVVAKYDMALNELYTVDLELIEMDLQVVNAIEELFNQDEYFSMVLADKTGVSKSRTEWIGCFIKEFPKSSITTAGTNAFNVNFPIEYLEKRKKVK